MKFLDYHPLANLFPLIEGEAFDELVADVRANGVREPVILLDGKILDGRNRFRAGIEAGFFTLRDDAGLPRPAALFQRFDRLHPGVDPLAWVVSKNLRRRHLTDDQRRMVAARIANIGRGGDRKSDDAKIKTTIGRFDRKKAAQMLAVDEKGVERARAVVTKGAEELQQAVDQRRVTVRMAADLAALPKEAQREIVALADPAAIRAAAKKVREQDQAAKKERRQEREAELGARQAALPEKKYGIIYADPEWRFQPYSAETGMDRAADNHYPTSELKTLMSRDVGRIAAKDCVLFLWATVPMLIEAICVADAWGFCWLDRAESGGHLTPVKNRARYVSSWAWLKEKEITGYWTRGKHELLLIFTRGKPVAPAMGEQLPSWVSAESVLAAQTDHSAKPELFLDWIDRLWPATPKIELNRRGPARSGWDAWGNEAGEGAA